jgi:hypothetical protein|tara:strand:+ start:1041 stop:1172 length:132 start_codon:yes stop_codon:yes gene_type:complete
MSQPDWLTPKERTRKESQPSNVSINSVMLMTFFLTIVAFIAFT